MIITTDKEMRERDPHDFYPTPSALCVAALNLLPKYFTPRRVLDPGAGAGVWGEVARARWSEAYMVGVELRDDATPNAAYDDWQTGDFMLYGGSGYDLVIGNPPYKYAEKFIRLSNEMLAPGGWIVFLLRLAFLEGQDRGAGLWREMPPQSVHVLSRRPSFITSGAKKGNTDATAYAVYVWRKPHNDQTTLLWLDWNPEPISEMKQVGLFDQIGGVQ